MPVKITVQEFTGDGNGSRREYLVEGDLRYRHAAMDAAARLSASVESAMDYRRRQAINDKIEEMSERFVQW